MINEILEYFDDPGDALIRKVLQDTEEAHQGLLDGSVKVCKKCNQNKPKEDFANPNTMSGYGRYCKDCTGPKTKKKKRKNSVKRADGKRNVRSVKKFFLMLNSMTGVIRVGGEVYVEHVKESLKKSAVEDIVLTLGLVVGLNMSLS